MPIPQRRTETAQRPARDTHGARRLAGSARRGLHGFSGKVQFAHMPATPRWRTVTHGTWRRWRFGNNHDGTRVAARFELPSSISPIGGSDVTTTTAAALRPQHVALSSGSSDAGWVEESDELQGTAVFDATGDATTMPSWDELVRQHADRVYRLAYRLSGNQHDAEDLTQETFIRVFRSVQNYQPGTFEGWLHRITTNLFLDMVRRRAASGWRRCPRTTTGCPPTSPTPSRSTTIRGSAPTCRRRWTRCRRSSAPRSCCATSRVCPTRRSARRSA